MPRVCADCVQNDCSAVFSHHDALNHLVIQIIGRNLNFRFTDQRCERQWFNVFNIAAYG